MKVKRDHASGVADTKEAYETAKRKQGDGRLVFPKPACDLEKASDDTHRKTHEKE